MRTRATDLFAIRHPIVLGGMSTGTAPELVAAVSNAGGLGVFGATGSSPAQLRETVASIRAQTNQPFGLNLLLFMSDQAAIDAALEAKPAVFSTSWPTADQDLRAVFGRAHGAGAVVMHMVSTIHEARRAADAGADLIVAQGTEGGGHVGVIGSMVLVPQVVRAVAPVPVLAAGGIADGAGLAAALMLGAEGALLGTRFLASNEAPLADSLKAAICRSDGHDTFLSELPDVINGAVWPGAFARTLRTPFVQRWLGREADVRLHRAALRAQSARARQQGDVDNSVLLVGQDAGLIQQVQPAGEIVERIVREAETIIRERQSLL